MTWKPVLFGLALVVALCLIPTTRSFTNPTDVGAFQDLYYATDGPNWSLSVNISDPCGWERFKRFVQCDADGYFTKLELFRNNLVGTIPTTIGNFAKLTSLSLRINSLSGTIPTQIGLLTKLTTLWLFDNQLSGTIPTELAARVAVLKEIRLYNNQLIAPLPALSPTNLLWLTNNRICPLPNYSSYAANHDYISSDCACSLTPCQNGGICTSTSGGTTPSDYSCDCSNTGYFGSTCSSPCADASAFSTLYSAMDGPSWVWQPDFASPLCIQSHRIQCDSSGKIVSLDLSNNRLRGTFPNLSSFTSLTLLVLRGNNIYGAIPTEIGVLTSLKVFDVRENSLYGSIPTQVGLLTALEVLNIGSNLISGSFPAATSSLTNMVHLIADNNQMTGSVGFSTLTKLQTLDLSFNKFSGSLPTTVSAWTSLSLLHLNDNKLTGSLPTQLGALTTVKSLLLQNNLFTGSIPTQIVQPAKYAELQLGGSSLCPLSDYSTSGAQSTDFTNYLCDQCLVNPCLSGGNCTNYEFVHKCTCPSGYIGSNCQFADSCSSSPCLNNGTCYNLEAGGYSCSCPVGKYGTNCELEDFCLHFPCQNGGSCNNLGATYNCSCYPAFSGTDCEVENYCYSNPCTPGSTCVSGATGFTCTCPTGKSGTTCAYTSYCYYNSVCGANALCVDVLDLFSCSCYDSYGGYLCENRQYNHIHDAGIADGNILHFAFNALNETSDAGYGGTLTGVSSSRASIVSRPTAADSANKVLHVTALPSAIAVSSPNSISTQNFTFEMVINTNGNEGEYLMLNNAQDFSSPILKFEVSASGVVVLYLSGSPFIRTDPLLTTGYHHVLFTTSSSSTEVYVDGALAASVASYFTGLNTSTLWTLICPACLGYLDEFFLYEKHFLPHEVLGHYTALNLSI